MRIAMSQLSDTPGVTQAYRQYVYVPFSVQLRVDPIRGKRFEIIRDLEIQANLLETLLESICNSTTDGEIDFDYTKPIAFTPQYGNKPARFSFHGHLCRRNSFPKDHLGSRTIISDSQYKTGDWAANQSNKTPDNELNNITHDFKTLIESTTSLTVIKLEIAGLIYGNGGIHFPL
jgi:hypothetical protein